MAVYKFRVTFEEYDDVHRDIEIRSTQTFEDFFNCIQEAIKFDNKHDASFYMSDDNWVKGQEITLNKGANKDIPLMKKSRLCDFIMDPHQKIYYVYDFENNWTFFVELIKIIVDDDKNAAYPKCVRSVMEPPKQYGITELGLAPTDLDFINNEIYEEEEIIDGGDSELKEEGVVMSDETLGFAEEESEGSIDESEEI